MTILAIETSCDETAMAVLDITDLEHITVRANVVSSQAHLHAAFGGVVPMLAAREHEKNISHVFEQTLAAAGVTDFKKEIDLIVVTHGPGLGPALIIGVRFAKALAEKYSKPVVGTSHMKGHIYSNWLSDPANKLASLQASKPFPVLNLIVSGGHTELVLMQSHNNFQLIGETMDDAVGEAFDKVARLVGLPYPGGPAVSKLAAEFKTSTLPTPISLPRPMVHSKNYNFSFSGLKTAVLYTIRDLKAAGIELSPEITQELCHEFQEAAVDVLVQKTIAAAQEHGVSTILLSGGVSANALLRETLRTQAESAGYAYAQPPMAYTTDNAAMIGVAGWAAHQYEKAPTDWQTLDMHPNLNF